MKATVRTDGGVTDEIVVENGLRHSCTMAPVLFNLYYGVVVQAWLQRLQFQNIPVGVTIQSCINGNLFSCTSRNVGQSNRVSDFEFADDAVLLATDRELAIRALSCFYEVACEFGLTVNCAKTKFMVVGDIIKDEDCMPMQIADGIVEYVWSGIVSLHLCILALKLPLMLAVEWMSSVALLLLPVHLVRSRKSSVMLTYH